MSDSRVICDRTGKKMFLTPKQAEDRRKTLKRKRNERLASYRCRHCGRWHLGHVE